MTAPSSEGYLERPRGSSLADVVDLILDKGLVVDAFVRVSVLGLELLTIDARIVIASVDTYLRFAEAADRVMLGSARGQRLPDMLSNMVEGGARGKTKGIAEGAKETVKEAIGLGDEDESDTAGKPRSRSGR
ncbi:MAG TPA: gas vesicle protein GvpJ [Natronosporangium sp.]